MKKLSLLLPLLAACCSANAQTVVPYATDLFGEPYSSEKLKQANEEYHRTLLKQYPSWDIDRAAFEKMSLEFIASPKKSAAVPQALITIPVVVHIVYNQPIENISDAQVFSQIIVLNEDFSRSAADTGSTPGPFKALAGNPQIQFCLAKRDPNGNPTTGIERRQTSVTSFTMDNKVKFFSQGGLDIWDPARYFNIWVCNTGGVCWGEFPTSTLSTTWGAVMHHIYMGSKYTIYGNFPNINAYYDRGELAVHEVGHCLNLRHIWGDDGTSCLGSDTCADTPNQQGPSSYCPTFPFYDSCTTSGAGLMFMDFMDYSDDDCYNMFSLGQVARMNAVMSVGPYSNLKNSNGCMPVGIEEIPGQTLFRIEPNPSRGIFRIIAEQTIRKAEVTDLLGKLIYTSEPNSIQTELNLEGRAKGIYFLRINESRSSKLILD